MLRMVDGLVVNRFTWVETIGACPLMLRLLGDQRDINYLLFLGKPDNFGCPIQRRLHSLLSLRVTLHFCLASQATALK